MMAKIGKKTWITEIRPTVTDSYLAPQYFAPRSFANCCPTRVSGTYAFYDMAVPVQALLTDATNLNIMQKHRSMNTIFLLLLLCFRPKGHMKLKFAFKHLHHYA